MLFFKPNFIMFIFFVFPALMAFMNLSNNMEQLSFYTIILIVISYMFFFLGGVGIKICCTSERQLLIKCVCNKFYISSHSVWLLISLILLFSIILLSYFQSIGGPPVFLEDIDKARASMGGAYQFISMMVKPVLVVAFSLLFMKSKINFPRNKFLNLIFYISILAGSTLLLLTGSRGHLLFILLIALIIRFVFYPPAIITIFILGFIGMVAISLLRFFRQYIIFGDSYLKSVSEVWYFGDNFIYLYPGYLTLTMNFSVLEKLVQTFGENGESFHYGYNLFLPFIAPIWPGKQSTLGDFQNEIWKTNFDYNLTSTILGVPYADFGPLGCFIVMMLIGFLTKLSLFYFFKFASFTSAFLYAQMLSFVIFSFYSYPLTGLHSFLYPIISYTLFRVIVRKKY